MNFTLGTFPEQGDISPRKELLELPYFSRMWRYYRVPEHPSQLDKGIQLQLPLASWRICFNEGNLRWEGAVVTLTGDPLSSWSQGPAPTVLCASLPRTNNTRQSGCSPVIRDSVRPDTWPWMPLKRQFLKAQAEFSAHSWGQAEEQVDEGRGDAVTGVDFYWICFVCQKLLRGMAPFPKPTLLSHHTQNFSALVFMRRSSKCQIRIIGSQT